ncbi:MULTISPECIES: hypothetical protein [unclassified Exiguobacterium]|uniref:hypothetical protein n=1 Tax=unclassified Exiguobacterium TaxID=2644629 RepID=UPI001BE953A8|nr:MULTISPECIES: hypothetical protein [unclassified Exiguobacterium]
MKKMLIVSVIGLASGVIYWLRKKEQYVNNASKIVDERVDFESEFRQKNHLYNLNTAAELSQDKNKIALDIYERHSEAREIMRDAYSDIMENFVDDTSGEKDKNKESMIDHESVLVMKEIDLISDELDELLK